MWHRNSWFVILFLSLNISVFGQTDTTLSGTMALPWTQNQQYAKGYGLFLDSVTIDQCDDRTELTTEKI